MADAQPQDAWGPPKAEPTHLVEETLTAWRSMSTRIRALAARDGLNRSEVARRADVPLGTFTPVIDGTYTGNYANQVAKITRWLDSVEEVRSRVTPFPDDPVYVETPTSREVVDTLLYAQTMPLMAVVTLGSGMGKTKTAEHYVATRPSSYLVTMRPQTAGVHRMLQEIALSLDINERNGAKLDRAIGGKLKRNGRQTLLIVDEAQNLQDIAVDQLRFFLDVYKCGIVLLGNEEIYSRFGKTDLRDGYGQIHRRIGKRLRRLTPLAGDVEAIIDAWGVKDDGARKLLRAVGRKAGTLGQMSQTIKLATVLAAGDGAELTKAHVEKAWENRGGEEARP
ncbi:AAA family ATPase [Methylopila sp. 73B]|uniref:AAA family ATPase n=1 Tax=Methylopila sp. 73B TaxID=1120792 RepID=UPI00055D981B|nr:AAA family ATPase [Methylopila sp. 73B]